MRCEFSGYSDDTFGEYHFFRDDYDNCASGRPIRYRLYSESQRAGLVIWGQYCPDGCDGWLVGVAPIDPDCDDQACQRAMGWSVSFQPCSKNGTSYSPLLAVENAPNDCVLTCMEQNNA